MTISTTQIKNVLIQLGFSEDNINKDLLEEIEINCKNVLDVMSYVEQKTKITRKYNSKAENMEGILIAASEDARFDSFFDNSVKSFLSFKDYRNVKYLKDEGYYVLTDEYGNLLTDDEGNVRALTPLYKFIGYLYANDKIYMIKSEKPLPTNPCYVNLSGKSYATMFIVKEVINQRELSGLEWEVLNNIVDEHLTEIQDKFNMEGKSSTAIFIGNITYNGAYKDNPTRGILDTKTVFKVSSFYATAFSTTLQKSAGIYIGVLNVKKNIGNDGNTYWNRTLTHPVKLQK